MATIIQNIEIINNKYEWLGYVFTMSDSSKNITCKISNSQNCCEQYGIYTKNNIDDYIGAEYYSIDVVKNIKHEMDYTMLVEVSINTSKGTILIKMYNEHNGFYPHDFFIQSENYTKIESL
jgi:hypothetical protein